MISPENCDDGSNDGLGCAIGCDSGAAVGYTCVGGNSTAPTICNPICGDKLIYPNETCDDGGTTSGDGCSSTC